MRNSFLRAATILVAIAIVYAASAAGQSTKRVMVPAGTRILIRTIDALDSSKQKAGYRFTASRNEPASGRHGCRAEASSAGRMYGSSQLTLELTDIVINGTAYPLLTSTFEVKGKGEGKKTAGKVLGGTGLGALIGGVAGGGTGAAIGALAGAAGGTALAASKKGEQLQIPSESLLEFRLEQPASLPIAEEMMR